MCKFIGIDISKQTFDVSFLKKEQWFDQVFKNDSSGFIKLRELLTKDDLVIMEASWSLLDAIGDVPRRF